MTLAELLKELPSYNEVAGHMLPSGELCLMLNHRVTLDNAVLVRVRADEDVLAFYTEDEAAIEVINTGGDWPS
jgi:hypothetical protein